MNPDRDIVKVFLEHKDYTTFEDFDTLGELLACVKEKSPVDVESLKIAYNYDSREVWLYYEREETDEEYETRIKLYKSELEAKEKRERAEYLRLKEKFEGELK